MAKLVKTVGGDDGTGTTSKASSDRRYDVDGMGWDGMEALGESRRRLAV